MVGVAPRDRVVLQRAEALSEGDVLGPGDVLVTDEQDPVLQQQRAQLGEEVVAARGVRKADAVQLGTDAGGEALDPEVPGRGDGELGLVGGGHDGSLVVVAAGQRAGWRLKTEEPMLRPDSRSVCACTASSSA